MNSRKFTLILVMSFVLMFIAGQTALADPPGSGGGGGGGGSHNHHNGPEIDVNVENNNTLTNCITNEAKAKVGDITVTAGDVIATSGDAKSKSKSSAASDSVAIIKQGSITYEDRVQGVRPGTPSHLWQVPRETEKFLWNQRPEFDTDGAVWTMKEVKKAINPSKCLGLFWPEWGKGFKSKVTCWVELKQTNKIKTFEYGKDLKPDSLSGYEKIGYINLKADNSNEVSPRTIMEGRRLAMNAGADVAVYVSGLNTINQGSSFGLGGSHVYSENNGALTGAGGIGAAHTFKKGEPAVVFVIYRRL